MALDSLFSSGLQVLFYIAMLSFVVYSIILAYHWFMYGSSKALSMLSLAVYLIGSAVFFIMMSTSLYTL
jgi:hypothetical protein